MIKPSLKKCCFQIIKSKCLCWLTVLASACPCLAQLTPFEKSDGTETASYFEAISFYKAVAGKTGIVKMIEAGETDAGYPLHVILVSAGKDFDPAKWQKENKVIIMINNGIHPGEPDGIDASMMLVRDIVNKKIFLPSNVVLAIIPVYNIGGCLNRNNSTRVNQNGPVAYGFRGNAQNLDLNRDFTKNDSKEAQRFATIFHWLNPDILIDNHVSDGADFQHTMTLISTQYDKLGPVAGKWLKDFFEPQLYSGMKERNWDLIPYVEFDAANFEKGIDMFYETPRYSSGYAALFGTFSFMPETHMLKPYRQRVQSTYDLMCTFITKASANAKALKEVRKKAALQIAAQQIFPLKWAIDRSAHSDIVFNGYSQDTAISEATGLPKMFYNHNKAFSKTVHYFNSYKPVLEVKKPLAYIIPAGWYEIIRRLQLNAVKLKQLQRDTQINVTVYKIEDFKSRTNAYEKHHINYAVKTSSTPQAVSFLKGDYVVELNQPANRYIIEMLEPTGEDSFFAWNFFDAILQQKEGYSDYRWEDIAADVLKNDTDLRNRLNAKKLADPVFAQDAGAMLKYIYNNSRWLEKSYLRYPVYRIE